MSANNPKRDSTSDHHQTENDEQIVSTGLQNLDDSIKENGLRSETVTVVISPPRSIGRLIVANMVRDRPAVYYTIGRKKESVKNILTDIPKVTSDNVSVIPLSMSSPLEEFESHFQKRDKPDGSVVVLDPTNHFESVEPEQYMSFLEQFYELISEVGAIGILLSISPSEAPSQRWMTLDFADNVFRVIHESDLENVTDYLAIERLDPTLSLTDMDARVFELDNDIEIDVSTSRNVSL